MSAFRIKGLQPTLRGQTVHWIGAAQFSRAKSLNMLKFSGTIKGNE